MLKFEEIIKIKTLYKQGHKVSEIVKETGRSAPTVYKYIKKEDFNEPEPAPESDKPKRSSKLDPFKEIIDGWLIDDLTNGTRKQRHNGRRVYERLKEEHGYTGGIRIVQTYVSKRLHELGIKKEKGFIPLVHRPGEAQVDFGECENYIENGIKYPGAHLSLSFPASNAGFAQLTYGQSTECLLEGLVAIFEHIGGVPREIWFDNAPTMIATVGKNVDSRVMTKRFERFVAHYGFDPHFANVRAGNEKGSVERKVHTTRVDVIVPVPRFTDLSVFNKGALEKCDKMNQKTHYNKDVPISELFKKDQATLLPLPSMPFDTNGYYTVRTDKCGRFTMDDGYSIYSSSPAHASSTVRLEVTGTKVVVKDEENKEIVTHRRIFGSKNHHRSSIIWEPYLDFIAFKPRAWFNSGLCEMAPDEFNNYLKKVPNSDRHKVIRVIAKITKKDNFENAIQFVKEALSFETYDHDAVMRLYDRFYADEKKEGGNAPSREGSNEVDLSEYDNLLKGE